MKPIVSIAAVAAFLVGIALVQAQEPPEMPAPAKEHAWLQQLVGEWEVEMEMTMEPGAPPSKSKGAESVRSIGGFWTHGELTCSMMSAQMTGFMTLGYDPEKKQYTGTWIDSFTSHLWIYKGSLDAAGKVLTLEAEGPDMMNPKSGKKVIYRDAIEIKGMDHKVLTSSAPGPDGKYVTFMTGNYKRKK